MSPPCQGLLLSEYLLIHKGMGLLWKTAGMGLEMGEKSHHPWLEALLTLQETPAGPQGSKAK